MRTAKAFVGFRSGANELADPTLASLSSRPRGKVRRDFSKADASKRVDELRERSLRLPQE